VSPINNDIFYLSGRYEGKASVMKFQKRTGRLEWWAKFSQLTSIRSIAPVPNDSIFYGCGDYQENEDVSGIDNLETEAIYSAGIFKMQKDGTVKWFMKIGGSNPVNANPNQDRCYGVTVDTSTGHVTSLLQVKAKEIRSSSLSYGDFYDTVLLQIDGTGNYINAVQISNKDSKINMYSASNGIFALNGDFFFAGWSAGFQTKLQINTYTTTLENQDAYLYRYKFGHSTAFDCIYEKDISRSTMNSVITLMPQSTFYSNNLITLYSNDKDL
jgi:hypothetical protein